MIRNKIVKDDIIVRKSILHILNSGSGQIGLATNLIDMGPDLFDMIRDNVFKVFEPSSIRRSPPSLISIRP